MNRSLFDKNLDDVVVGQPQQQKQITHRAALVQQQKQRSVVSDQDFHNTSKRATKATASNAFVGGPSGMVITPKRVRRSHNSSNLSVGPKGMLIQPQSVTAETVNTDRTSRRTVDSATLQVSIQQQKFLVDRVKKVQ